MGNDMEQMNHSLAMWWAGGWEFIPRSDHHRDCKQSASPSPFFRADGASEQGSGFVMSNQEHNAIQLEDVFNAGCWAKRSDCLQKAVDGDEVERCAVTLSVEAETEILAGK